MDKLTFILGFIMGTKIILVGLLILKALLKK